MKNNELKENTLPKLYSYSWLIDSFLIKKVRALNNAHDIERMLSRHFDRSVRAGLRSGFIPKRKAKELLKNKCFVVKDIASLL